VRKSLFLTAVMVLVVTILPAPVRGQTEGDDTEKQERAYPDLLLEKVGEVAEIRYKEMIENRAVNRDGDKALMRLAHYRFFKNDYAGSEYYLRSLLERYGDSELTGEARLWLGSTHLARGETRATLVELQGGFQELEASNATNDDLSGRYLFWIGEAYLRDGKTSDAREYLERFYETFPRHSYSALLSDRLRTVYADLGMRQALEKLERRAAITPPVVSNPDDDEALRAGEYLVQVASFSSEESAEILAEDLDRTGFKASVYKVKLDSGVRHRVVLGGFTDRAAADTAAMKLEKEGYGKAIVERRK